MIPQHLPDKSRKNETRRKLRVFLLCYIVLLIYTEGDICLLVLSGVARNFERGGDYFHIF